MKQQGFSLVELMIVIVIVGVLGSIAIPAYHDYVIRAKVTELITLAGPAKLAVTESLIAGVTPEQIDNIQTGIEKIQNKGRIKELTIVGGVITVTGNSKELDLPEDKELKIALKAKKESSHISWQCTVEPVEFKKYVPGSCRG